MNSGYLSSVLLAAGLVASAMAAEQPLVIDPALSRIEVAVTATVDSFVGRLVAYEPEIVVADDGTITHARLAFHFRDVHTGKERRDEAMHKWQQTATHPDGLFVLTSFDSGDAANGMARGRLTLHGVTREVEFPVSINRDGRRYAVDGDVAVDTREFGLPAIRMLALLKVNPVVRVRFHLQGTSPTPMVSAAGRP